MASLNEQSARYSVLPNEFYIPNQEDVRAQATTNRQGREGDLGEDSVDDYIQGLQHTCSEAYETYEGFLKAGVTRELARCALPVNVYTKKVWAQDLHNLFHFLSLRMDSHAQQEIREYANAIAEIVKVWVPWAWEAFEDYRLKAMYLSKFEVLALQHVLSRLTAEGYKTDALIRGAVAAVGVTGREKTELTAKLEGLFQPPSE